MSAPARSVSAAASGTAPSDFIITYKFRLAAAAAIIGGVRCHHWQRPLPIMSPPAANLKSMPLFPLRCLPLPFLSCAASPECTPFRSSPTKLTSISSLF